MTRVVRPKKPKQVQEVFGVSNEVLPDSYVDRGDLDEELARLLSRPTHIALRGASKCGLRQTVLPEALVVQCRLKKTTLDIYRDALSQLGVSLEVEASVGTQFKGSIKTSGDLGIKLLAKLGVEAAIEALRETNTKTEPVGHDVTDLRFIADLLKASERRLVIEDFHYLSVEERRAFAFDLKALWDYGVFVVIVGVWSEQNLLMYLNPDMAGRVKEVPIVWSDEDLKKIFERGGEALNIEFGAEFQDRAIADCFENAGVLQALILGMLDEARITEASSEPMVIDDVGQLEAAAMAYADELNPLYQLFAERVSGGIRKRENATGIYAHAMAAIMGEPDDSLIRGISIDRIYEIAHKREDRIQKGNLHTVLEKFEGLQVDDDGRGLVIAYNEAHREVSVVDRQLLLYRKYLTVGWPWEELIAEATSDANFQLELEPFDTASTR